MDIEILTQNTLYRILSRLKNNVNKGDLGTLTVVAGSSNYRGAASLCSGAALKTGVGIVRLVSVEKACACTAYLNPSCTFLSISENDQGMMSYADLSTKNITEKSTALLCGCGLGQSDDTQNIVSSVISSEIPKVIDADALNIISRDIDSYSLDGVIITPHIGEMARLCKKGIAEIKADRPSAALEFSKEHSCITVLKDDITYITSPDGNVFESSLGNAGLAKGGSGDVLAGFIAGFLAQGYKAIDSALAGTVLHGLCARLCEAENGRRAMSPSQLSDYASIVFKNLGV